MTKENKALFVLAQMRIKFRYPNLVLKRKKELKAAFENKEGVLLGTQFTHVIDEAINEVFKDVEVLIKELSMYRAFRSSYNHVDTSKIHALELSIYEQLQEILGKEVLTSTDGRIERPELKISYTRPQHYSQPPRAVTNTEEIPF